MSILHECLMCGGEIEQPLNGYICTVCDRRYTKGEKMLDEFGSLVTCPNCGTAYNHGDLHEPELTRRITVQIDNTTVEIALARDISGRDAAKALKRACRALRKTY